MSHFSTTATASTYSGQNFASDGSVRDPVRGGEGYTIDLSWCDWIYLSRKPLNQVGRVSGWTASSDPVLRVISNVYDLPSVESVPSIWTKPLPDIPSARSGSTNTFPRREIVDFDDGVCSQSTPQPNSSVSDAVGTAR